MDDRESRAFSALSELGFQAAEMRSLNGQLAEACARKDLDTACDLAEALLVYQRDFAHLYRRLLAIGTRTRNRYRS
jgi:hypothetical protein